VLDEYELKVASSNKVFAAVRQERRVQTDDRRAALERRELRERRQQQLRVDQERRKQQRRLAERRSFTERRVTSDYSEMRLQEERLKLRNKKYYLLRGISISVIIALTLLILYLLQISGTFLS
jgi:hypothetical protein